MHAPAVVRLVTAARQRGTTLVVMPPGMSRRAGNSSRYEAKADVLSWRMHCVFVASSAPFVPSALLSQRLEGGAEGGLATKDGLVGMSLNAVADSTLVGDVLVAFLDAGSVAGNAPCTAVQAHALRHLRLARSSICAYVQWIPSPAHDPVFAQVPLEGSVRSALEGKSVVEYPVVVFGRRQDMGGLRLRMAEVEGGAEQEDRRTAGEGDSGSESDDSDDGTDFMQALREMGGKDVSALQTIIEQGEG